MGSTKNETHIDHSARMSPHIGEKVLYMYTNNCVARQVLVTYGTDRKQLE